jgi:hypothetical protein
MRKGAIPDAAMSAGNGSIRALAYVLETTPSSISFALDRRTKSFTALEPLKW